MLTLLLATEGRAQPREYQLKAVFLFHLTQFVDWPSDAFTNAKSPYVIGVLGSNPFQGALEAAVKGEVVRNRTIEVLYFKSVKDISACHILFVTRAASSQLPAIIVHLDDKSVLTVVEVEGLEKRGGVICFIPAGDKLRLRVNLAAAKTARLNISTKLLRWAEIVGNVSQK